MKVKLKLTQEQAAYAADEPIKRSDRYQTAVLMMKDDTIYPAYFQIDIYGNYNGCIRSRIGMGGLIIRHWYDKHNKIIKEEKEGVCRAVGWQTSGNNFCIINIPENDTRYTMKLEGRRHGILKHFNFFDMDITKKLEVISYDTTDPVMPWYMTRDQFLNKTIP